MGNKASQFRQKGNNESLNAASLSGIQIVGQYIIEHHLKVPNLFTDTESGVSYCMSVDGELLDEIIKRIDQGNKNELITLLNSCTPFLIAASIKAYLKDLSVPLIPANIYNALINAYKKGRDNMTRFTKAGIKDSKVKQYRAKSLIPSLERLPEVNYNTISHSTLSPH